MRKPSSWIVKLMVMCICAAVLAVWVALRLSCPIRELTGIPCPGCGMGRAWLAVLRFDFSGAFRYHPLFWAVPVVALFIIRDFRLFRAQKYNTFVMVFLGIAVTVCYFIRLAAYFREGLVI